MPASWPRHQASSGSRRSPARCRRCQAAKSAYCMGSSGSGLGRPAWNAS